MIIYLSTYIGMQVKIRRLVILKEEEASILTYNSLSNR